MFVKTHYRPYLLHWTLLSLLSKGFNKPLQIPLLSNTNTRNTNLYGSCILSTQRKHTFNNFRFKFPPFKVFCQFSVHHPLSLSDCSYTINYLVWFMYYTSKYNVSQMNDTNLPRPRAATSVATRIGDLPDRNSATKHCKFVYRSWSTKKERELFCIFHWPLISNRDLVKYVTLALSLQK